MKWMGRFGLVIIIGLLGFYVYRIVVHPLPVIKPALASAKLTIQTTAPALNWPADGAAAVGIAGSDVLISHGSVASAPTASTAKLITALTVLKAKPLTAGQPGPTITLGANDVALYNNYKAEGGSVVPVTAGEQISEYQVLEAMLLPSANNMADSLAGWAYGSLSAYATAANDYLTQLGLAKTHVGSDASGFDPSTTSTPVDLVRLGEIAMQNPVLAGIVNQPTAADIPNTAGVQNINTLLGSHNIVGIKTGNTSQAGGVFVSASTIKINGRPQTIVTALMGAPTLGRALSDSLPLIDSAQANFQTIKLISAGAVVGHYQVPWGGSVAAVATSNLTVTTWRGSLVPATIKLESTAGSANDTVGRVSTPATTFDSQQSVTVKLQTAIPKPSLWWRLTHP